MYRPFQTKAVFEYSQGTRWFVQSRTGAPALTQALPGSLSPWTPISTAQEWRNAPLPLLLWGSPQSQQELEAQVAELHLIMLSMCPWIKMQRFRAKHCNFLTALSSLPGQEGIKNTQAQPWGRPPQVSKTRFCVTLSNPPANMHNPRALDNPKPLCTSWTYTRH